MATEDQSNEAEKECLYKTKVIQFLGRTTPIILQNDNGPCPLLAICNVLLLKNNLNLNVESSEVSLQKLLSLVAERIIDSNSNVENKNAEYAQNQQQNIGDAMDLLPRLSTGIDVNIKFRRIDDFEFTRECTIFDLLDIPLYHGWIVDPQDTETACAIGSKSYNTLTAELVALETSSTPKEQETGTDDDLIDFAAATAATLGVPSPCLAKSMSFDESPLPEACPSGRKGDVEEEVELLRALKLSTECPTNVNESFTSDANENTCMTSSEITHPKTSDSGVITDTIEQDLGDEQKIVHQPDLSISHDCKVSPESSNGGPPSETISGETNQLCKGITDKGTEVIDLIESANSDALLQNQNENVQFPGENSSSDCTYNGEADHEIKNTNTHDQNANFQFSGENFASEYAYNGRGYEGGLEPSKDNLQDACTLDNESSCDSVVFAAASGPIDEPTSSDGKQEQIGTPKSVASSLDNSEPLYEGEERILDAGQTIYETREPVYEGELVLSEKADTVVEGACTPHEGDLVRGFLRNNASQLTIFGLFCLQEGLKERELCVFFRNNHFSTMFKFNGELYLLATDQGYINQPDLVWEKLNEVNGDTVFMTGNFKEFKLENQGNVTWDEQNAMASTADYLANMDHSNPEASTFSSDLQLAIALQQKEYENQQQQQPPNLQQPSSGGSSSGLVVGPQRPKTSSSNSSSKQEAKSKDKCTVM